MKNLPRQIEIVPDHLYSIERLCFMFERNRTDHFRRKYFRTPDDPADGRILMVQFDGAWVSLGAWIIRGIIDGTEESEGGMEG